MNWKELENFMRFLKSLAYNKNCSVHRFLIGAENLIKEAPWEEEVCVFLEFARKRKKLLFL